jgi:prepilin-type N-terminal cleavage/methylation domain-containing protein
MLIMNKSKGFTIIELIVVITLITVLAGIVLINVTQYLGKGKDSAIQANLSGALTHGTTFYESSSNYEGYCVSQEINSVREAVIADGGSFVCNVSPENDAWCSCSTLPAKGSVFCVDSTGAKKDVPSTNCDTECPTIGFCQ